MKRFARVLLVSIPSIAFLSVEPALADDGLSEKIDRLFQRYDADGDGKITPAELTDAATFQSLDKNGDGIIAREDFGSSAEGAAKPPAEEPRSGDEPEDRPVRKPEGTGPAGRGQAKMGEFDADGDGRISLDEFLAQKKKEFARGDKNGDGFLDADEIREALRSSEAGSGAGAAAGKDGGRAREHFKEMDADGDGAVSREEWKGPEMMFDRVDADGDGKVTTEELQKMRGAGEGGKRPGAGAGEGGKRFGEGGEGSKRPALPEKDGDAAPRRPSADPSAMFTKLDRDGDGSLSGDELPGNQLQTLDADGDGKVSQDEFANAPIYKRDK